MSWLDNLVSSASNCGLTWVEFLEWAQQESKESVNQLEEGLKRKADVKSFADQKKKVAEVTNKVDMLEFKITSLATKLKVEELEKNFMVMKTDLNALEDRVETDYYTRESIDSLLAKARKFNKDTYVDQPTFTRQIDEIHTTFTKLRQ